MSEKISPVQFVKRNGLYMLTGIVVFGLAGYFLGGSSGRSLGSGIGSAVGLIVGGFISKTRPG